MCYQINNTPHFCLHSICNQRGHFVSVGSELLNPIILSLSIYLMSGIETKRILVGCTGSVASIKIPLLIQELQCFNNKVSFSLSFFKEFYFSNANKWWLDLMINDIPFHHSDLLFFISLLFFFFLTFFTMQLDIKSYRSSFNFTVLDLLSEEALRQLVNFSCVGVGGFFSCSYILRWFSLIL